MHSLRGVQRHQRQFLADHESRRCGCPAVSAVRTGVGHFFSKGLDYFTEFDALKAENEQLKQQISDNAQLVRDAQIALEENNQLRSQLGQPENTRTTTTVSAEVIARSPGDWRIR